MVSLLCWPRRIALATAAVVSLTGAIVLVGWALDSVPVESVLPNQPKMAPLTAALFVLSGIVLFCSRESSLEARRDSTQARILARLALIGAGAIAFLGALRMLAYIFSWRVTVDLLGFTESSFQSPARTAPATALGFAVLGGTLLGLRASRFRSVFQALALSIGLIGWLGLAHYLYGGKPLLPYGPMAVHTAIAFLFLSAGVLASHPNLGLVALVVSGGPGGKIARGLMPAALMLPVVIGWIRLQGERAGWYGTEAGVSLFGLVTVAAFAGLIWFHCTVLEQSDAERRTADAKVHAQVTRLNLLHRITEAIGERQDLSSIYDVVLTTLRESLPCDFACVFNYDSLRERLIVLKLDISEPNSAAGFGIAEHDEIPVDANGLSRCVSGYLVYEPDVSQLGMPFARGLSKAGLRSLVIAPLSVENKVFGILAAARSLPDSFVSADCEFLQQLSGHVPLAAHQAELNTSLQRAYDDLQQTQEVVMHQERLRALGQMASGVAHDINNALSPVMLCTEVVLDTEKNLSPKSRKHLETIQRAVSDAAQTVARMREFYRQREPESVLAPVDMNSLVPQVVDLTRARWSDMPQSRGTVVDVRMELASNLPAILGEESEIREALTNLVFNAVDALPNGGTLTLRTFAREGSAANGTNRASQTVYVEVADTGMGMDDETRLRCTEPFFTTKGERGTGLGLAMVHGIARRHAADLEIESCLGKGTTIRLGFAAHSAKPLLEHVEQPPSAVTPLNILVVDDDAMVARSLRDAL